MPGAIPLDIAFEEPSRARLKRKRATTMPAVSPATPATPAVSVVEATASINEARKAGNDDLADDSQHNTRIMNSLVVALVSKRALLVSQEDSASITLKTARKPKTVFPAEILIDIC